RPGAIAHRLVRPRSANRARHNITVLRLIARSVAIAESDCAAAAASTMRLRNATCCGVPWAFNQLSIWSRSLTLRLSAGSAAGMIPAYGDPCHVVQLFVGHYTSRRG